MWERVERRPSLSSICTMDYELQGMWPLFSMSVDLGASEILKPYFLLVWAERYLFRPSDLQETESSIKRVFGGIGIKYNWNHRMTEPHPWEVGPVRGIIFWTTGNDTIHKASRRVAGARYAVNFLDCASPKLTRITVPSIRRCSVCFDTFVPVSGSSQKRKYEKYASVQDRKNIRNCRTSVDNGI